MATIELEFEKSETGQGSKKYKVSRIKGSLIQHARAGDTIMFARSGQDDTKGFKVEFMGDSPPGTLSVPSGSKSDSVPAPQTKKVLVWKYKVHFEDDVEPYDPVIVINPGRSSFLTSLVVPFAVGVVAAFAAFKLFPGLLG